MDGVFLNHKEIKWKAEITGGFYSGAQKFQMTPSVDNFQLKKYDLLKSEPNSPQLKLIGEQNQTVIYIYCPEDMVQKLISKLDFYIGKPWSEIINIRL